MNGLVLTSNREITISAAGSRKAVSWPAQRLLISELYNRLQTPVRSAETYDEYMRLPKPQQDDLKDVGGFVGGTLKDNRRKAGNVISRDVIALDLDNIPAGGTDDVIQRVAGLGCGWSVYSTRKHCGAKPRLRCVIPLDESATPDEYEAISGKLAQIIGIELFDPTTFEPSRLMYWPSCCADSDYVFRYEDKPLLSKNGVLGMYADWQDMTQWPQVPGSEYTPRKLAAKQGDPTQKKALWARSAGHTTFTRRLKNTCRRYTNPSRMTAIASPISAAPRWAARWFTRAADSSTATTPPTPVPSALSMPLT